MGEKPQMQNIRLGHFEDGGGSEFAKRSAIPTSSAHFSPDLIDDFMDGLNHYFWPVLLDGMPASFRNDTHSSCGQSAQFFLHLVKCGVRGPIHIHRTTKVSSARIVGENDNRQVTQVSGNGCGLSGTLAKGTALRRTLPKAVESTLGSPNRDVIATIPKQPRNPDRRRVPEERAFPDPTPAHGVQGRRKALQLVRMSGIDQNHATHFEWV
jgi:hypothetical protein